jgi:hypothetical protein
MMWRGLMDLFSPYNSLRTNLSKFKLIGRPFQDPCDCIGRVQYSCGYGEQSFMIVMSVRRKFTDYWRIIEIHTFSKMFRLGPTTSRLLPVFHGRSLPEAVTHLPCLGVECC